MFWNVCGVVEQGLFDGLYQTTLIDIRDRLGTSTDKLALAKAFTYIGIPVGSVLIGVIYDRFQSYGYLLMTITLGITGIGLFFIPWSPWLPLSGTLFFIEGFGKGGMDAGNVFIFYVFRLMNLIPTIFNIRLE